MHHFGWVVCEIRYADCRPFCPRSVYPFWREIWLERTESPALRTRRELRDGAMKARSAASESARGGRLAQLSYVLITPARNEEAHIERTIKSVVSQTLRPLKWVIVSDGSTDRTDEIV